MKANKTSRRTIRAHLWRMDLAIAEWQGRAEVAAKYRDRELAAEYAADVAELKAFRDAFAAGDIDEARRLADAMDTIVRDQIPVQLYHIIFPER